MSNDSISNFSIIIDNVHYSDLLLEYSQGYPIWSPCEACFDYWIKVGSTFAMSVGDTILEDMVVRMGGAIKVSILEHKNRKHSGR